MFPEFWDSSARAFDRKSQRQEADVVLGVTKNEP
jgi:hypothetical protein